MTSEDDYGRVHDILIPAGEDLFYFAPVPIVYHEAHNADHDGRHAQLIGCAKTHFAEPELDVPDVRRIADLGRPPESLPSVWSESQNAAVGVWHRVPTNSFLSISDPAVEWLRSLIVERYKAALFKLGNASADNVKITESWIQFYKASDYKVLHNHERYGPP